MVSPIFRHKGLTAKNMLLPYANQIAILPRPMPKPAKPGKPRNYEDDYAQTGQELSIDSGDSGSVVIDFQGRVIAQIVAAGPFDPDVYVRKPEQRSLIEYQALVGKNLGIATPIQAIMDQLHITMLSHPSGFSGTVPSAGTSTRVFLSSASSDRQLEAARLTVVRLRKELGCTRRGKLLLGKIGQHRREVRMLLANVRAISSAWRELNGPAFYHHCFQSASNPRHVIPTCINGTTRDNLVEGLKPLFLIHASPALQRDIRRYGDRAAAALLGISTLDDAPNAVADRWPPQ